MVDLIDFMLEYFAASGLSFEYFLGWKWMDNLH